MAARYHPLPAEAAGPLPLPVQPESPAGRWGGRVQQYDSGARRARVARSRRVSRGRAAPPYPLSGSEGDGGARVDRVSGARLVRLARLLNAQAAAASPSRRWEGESGARAAHYVLASRDRDTPLASTAVADAALQCSFLAGAWEGKSGARAAFDILALRNREAQASAGAPPPLGAALSSHRWGWQEQRETSIRSTRLARSGRSC